MRLLDCYHRLRLKTKFALWTSLGVLAVVGLLTSLSLWVSRHDLTRSATDAQTALIDSVAEDLDEKIEMRRAALTLHSTVFGQRVALDDAPAIDDYFNSRPLLSSFFDAVLVADAAGKLIYDIPERAGRRGRSVADRDYFKQAMKTGQAVISQPLAGKASGQAGINFAVPVRNPKGEIVAALIGVVYLDRPNFLGALGKMRIGKEGYFALMSKGETPMTVMHARRDRIMQPVPVDEYPHVAKALRGFEGTVDDSDSRGLEALFSYRTLASVPWVLASVYPTAEAYATLRARQHEVVAVGVAMAAVSGVVSWLLAAHLLRPLRRLQQVMKSHRLQPDLPMNRSGVRSKDIAALESVYVDLMRHRQEAEAALRHSERRLRAIADNLPALVGYFDKTETYRFANAQYGTFFGVEPQNLLGRTVRELLGERAYAGVREQIAAVLRGEAQQFERSGASRNGDEHSLVSYTPDLNADGSVDGCYVLVLDITARKNAELMQALSERRLKAVTDNLPALITHIDTDQRYTFANAHARRVFGVDPAWMIGRSIRAVRGEAGYQDILPRIRRALAGETVAFESSGEANGQLHYFRSDYVPDLDECGTVRGFYAISFDLTERKTAELRLAHQEHMLRTITDNLPVLIAYVDRDETLRFANRTFTTWMGIDPTHAAGRPLPDAIGAVHYEAWRLPLLRALSGERCEFENDANAAGCDRQLHNICIPDRQPDGTIAGIFTLSTDITATKAAQRQLEDMARVDALTGLPNRRQFDEKLREALARAQRDGRSLVLMFLDIDHFKSINDSLGHAAGDAVLREFGARIKATIRVTDLAARLAGDEFVVLLEGVHHKDEAASVAQKIVDAVRIDFIVAGRPLKVTTSLGVALATHAGTSAEALLNCADEALYKAKKAGRDRYRLLPCDAVPATVAA